MTFRFQVNDVKIEIVTDKKEVTDPLYLDKFFSVSANELSVDLKDVARLFDSFG